LCDPATVVLTRCFKLLSFFTLIIVNVCRAFFLMFYYFDYRIWLDVRIWY